MKTRYFENKDHDILSLVCKCGEAVRLTRFNQGEMRLWVPLRLEERQVEEVAMLEGEREIGQAYAKERIDAFIEEIKKFTGYKALERELSAQCEPQVIHSVIP